MSEVRAPASGAEWAAYYALRWRVLRAPWNQPRGSEKDDLEGDAVHLMIGDADGRVLAVGRLHRLDDDSGQIRYMAVEPDCRGQGLGTRLLRELERAAADSGMLRTELHAREGCVPFYEKAGYRVIESSHLLFGKIQHFRMEKVLGG